MSKEETMAKKEIEEKRERVYVRPLANICEEDGKVLLRVEMPGVRKQDVELKVENNELRIVGKREAPAAEQSYILKERRDGDFYQSYTLDDTIDQGNIEAALDKGVLTVTLHLKEEVKPRQITIKTS